MSSSHCSHHDPLPRPSLAQLPKEEALLQALLSDLPADPSPITRLAVGGRFLAIEWQGQVGLASTLGASPGPGERERAQEAAGKGLLVLARLLLDDNPWLASLGLAALNAGLGFPQGASTLGAQDLLPSLCAGRRAVVVGDFPFAADLAKVAASLQVLEMRPGGLTADQAQGAQALAECQVAAISGTALLTRSLAGLLEQTRQALVVLVGPSTPWAGRLFEHGVDVLAGSRVMDSAAVMDAVEEDLPFHEIKRRGVKLAAWAREEGLLPR